MQHRVYPYKIILVLQCKPITIHPIATTNPKGTIMKLHSINTYKQSNGETVYEYWFLHYGYDSYVRIGQNSEVVDSTFTTDSSQMKKQIDLIKRYKRTMQ